jgi:hypothetical protein
VGDQDFNFPPSERREPKQFEAPPWERDAFDELARAKAEEQAAAEAAAAQAAAAEAEAVAAAAAKAAESVAAMDEAASMEAAGSAGAAEPTPVSGEDVAPEDGSQAKVSEAQVTEMMAGLRAEEPTSMQSYGAIAIALSVLTGLVGVVMLVWAMAMFVSANARGTGRVGLVSGSIVAFFGALFISLSMWVAVRTLRQRGVL